MEKLSKIELSELVKDALKEVLSSRPLTSDEFLSRSEVCERLKVSLPTLDKWTAEGIIQGRLIIGGRVRYRWAEVEQSINNNAA